MADPIVFLGAGVTPRPSVVTAANPLPTTVISTATNAYGTTTLVTRPANTTAYTAVDVVGATAAAIDLGVCGPSGGRVMIETVMLEPRIAVVPTGMGNFRLALFSATPTSALADNAAWTDPVSDNAEYLGTIDIGTPVDLGAKLEVGRNLIGKIVKLSGTNLFAYLITDGGFTPAANSEVYALTVMTVAL